MSLLKTKEYVDLVDLSQFMHENYDWPMTSASGSFHSAFCEAMSFQCSNGEMSFIELGDPDDIAHLEENYSEKYVEVAKAFFKLIEDGHLPKREEFEIYVWW
jgi:hypothetical protein